MLAAAAAAAAETMVIRKARRVLRHYLAVLALKEVNIELAERLGAPWSGEELEQRIGAMPLSLPLCRRQSLGWPKLP